MRLANRVPPCTSPIDIAKSTRRSAMISPHGHRRSRMCETGWCLSISTARNATDRRGDAGVGSHGGNSGDVSGEAETRTLRCSTTKTQNWAYSNRGKVRRIGMCRSGLTVKSSRYGGATWLSCIVTSDSLCDREVGDMRQLELAVAPGGLIGCRGR